MDRHEPAAFICALLNSLPMGFYSPSTLIQDVRRHGVEVRDVDVCHSDWDNTLEGDTLGGEQPAIRLGFRQIRRFPEEAGHRIRAAREQRAVASIADLCARASLDARASALLAEAGALKSLADHRHDSRWAVAGLEPQRPLFGDSPDEEAITLPVPTLGEDVVDDYRSMGLTLGAHPLSLLRTRLRRERCLGSADLQNRKHCSRLRAAGLVTMRQRPGTAGGAVFVTLEDEGGIINVVVWRDLAERQRRELLSSRLLAVDGQWERVDGVEHLIASHLRDLTPLLGMLETRSRDFR